MSPDIQDVVETIVGWIIIIVLVGLILYGIFSSNICNRLLIGIGIFGFIWLIFGSPILTRVEHSSGFRFFLPLSIVLFIIWIILKVSGVCSPLTELWRILSQS